MLKSLTFVCALFFALSSHAALLNYEIELGPNTQDADGGVLEFVWDTDAGVFNSMTWDFGAGASGGALSNIDWLADVFGDTQGNFWFETLTLVDAHSAIACNQIGEICSVGLGSNNISGFFTFIEFTLDPNNDRSYRFETAGGAQYSGAFGAVSFTTTSVPNPASIWLVILGMAGLVLSCRRKS